MTLKSGQQAGEKDVGVAAVNRALGILDVFSADEPILSLAQIAKKTGLYKSTILRLIESLEAFGFIKRLADGGYSLGQAPLRLATIYKNALQPPDIIVPALRALVELTRESASYYLPVETQRLCAYRVNSPRSIRDHVQVGQLLPLNKGAAGQVLLAFSGDQRGRWQDVRKTYFAISRGERDAETAAIAAPIFSSGHKLEGSLCLSGPLSRFTDEKVAEMVPPLLDKAREITAAFGGDASVFPVAK